MITPVNAKRMAIGLAMGILAWINILTIGLSTFHFGYLDLTTVAQMVAITAPPLLIGAALLHHFRAGARPRRAAAPVLKSRIA